MTAPSEAFQLMQQIDQFYNNSWNHLMLFATWFAAILGILIPLLNYFIQKRFFQLEERKLEAKIEEKNAATQVAMVKELGVLLAKEIEKLKVYNNAEFEAFKKNSEAQISKLEARADQLADQIIASKGFTRGLAFFLQTNTAIKEVRFVDAGRDAHHTITGCITGKDAFNLRRIGGTLARTILPKLAKADIERLVHEGFDFDTLLKEIEAMSPNSEFADMMTEIRLALELAKKRASVT